MWHSRIGKTNLEGEKADTWLPGVGLEVGIDCKGDGDTMEGIQWLELNQWGDGNALNCTADYLAVYICQNSLNCILEMGAFIVHKLFLNKSDLKMKP